MSNSCSAGALREGNPSGFNTTLSYQYLTSATLNLPSLLTEPPGCELLLIKRLVMLSASADRNL